MVRGPLFNVLGPYLVPTWSLLDPYLIPTWSLVVIFLVTFVTFLVTRRCPGVVYTNQISRSWTVIRGPRGVFIVPVGS